MNGYKGREFISDRSVSAHEADLDAHIHHTFEQYMVGSYYWGMGQGAVEGNTALTANRLYATSFVVHRDITIDRLAVQVAIAAAGKTLRIGIYNVDSDLKPGTRKDNGSTVDCSAPAAVKAATVSIALTKGLYYFGMICDGTPNINYMRPGESFVGLRSADLQYFDYGWYVADTYGNLPDPWPGGETLADVLPQAAFRVLTND